MSVNIQVPSPLGTCAFIWRQGLHGERVLNCIAALRQALGMDVALQSALLAMATFSSAAYTQEEHTPLHLGLLSGHLQAVRNGGDPYRMEQCTGQHPAFPRERATCKNVRQGQWTCKRSPHQSPQQTVTKERPIDKGFGDRKRIESGEGREGSVDKEILKQVPAGRGGVEG